MKKPSKVTRIILAIVVTLAVVAGLFIARTYLKGKVDIFAERAVVEKVLKYKSVANGDFNRDTLTGVVKQSKKIVLKTTNEKLTREGTIEGRINLQSATALTKMKLGVANLKPITEEINRVNLEVTLSKDGQNWSRTFSSNHTTTINFAQVLANSATKYKSIKYKITLETFRPSNTSSSPALTALTLWGKGIAQVSPTPSATISARTTATLSATATSTTTSTTPPNPPGPGDTVTPPNPPGPGDTVTPPNPPGPGDTQTPPTPETPTPTFSTVTGSVTPTSTPAESPTASPAQTKVTTDGLFNSPGSSVVVSGIQSGVSFTLLILAILGIGVLVIYRIAKSKE
jgi:hypothetical protein